MKLAPTLDERKTWRYLLQGVALGAIATVIVLLATTGAETASHLREFSPVYLPLLFAMIFTAWGCNGARMWLMCRAAGHPLTYRQAIAISLSTEFGIAATPAGVGGTIIRLSLLRRAGVPVLTAGSLLAADAAIDAVFFALLSPFAVFFVMRDGLPLRLFAGSREFDAFVALAIIIGGAIGAICLLRSAGFHRRVTWLASATAMGRRFRWAARYRQTRASVTRTLRRIVGALAFLWLHRKGALALNLVFASVQWCCRYLVLPVIIYSFGHAANPLLLFFVQGVLFALSLIVVAPGGGGSVELLTALVLPQLIPSGIVGVVVLVWRFFTYHLYLLGGGTMFFYTCRRLPHLKINAKTQSG